MSKLYIVATPIGNLKDVTLRALEVLKSVDLILCEDTRITKRLLNRYEIKTPTLSYHQHSKLSKVEYILKLIKEGKNLALVSDAGTPGISDPGALLVQEAIEKLGDNIKIEPIPGPSAVISALSISGVPLSRFVFLGFPPHKKGRQKFFKEMLNSEIFPVMFYESSHRIIKALTEIKNIIEGEEGGVLSSTFQFIVCRELTKIFETIYRGNIDEILTKIQEDLPQKMKGEFTVIISKY